MIALYLPQYVPFKTTFDIRNSLLIAFLQEEQQDYNTKKKALIHYKITKRSFFFSLIKNPYF
ncbi:hypothetical protein NACSLCCMFF_40094 [Tenacibaculum maritimum]|nr:hypothetical protein NACSLCCMFF_40094 [Tenacibaculum maritimum]